MDFDFTTETIIPESTNILTVAGSGGIEIPVGTTAERPVSPILGTVRYNTDINAFEVFAGSPGSWTTYSTNVLTTKGDILTRNSTENVRLPVGTNGQFLSANSSTTSGLEWVQNPAITYASIEDEPTGFPNRTDTEILFNETTRQFTIQPTGASFSVYVHGIEFVKSSAESITLPDVTDEYFIYYDTDGVLQYSIAFFDLQNVAPVSAIYWNSTSASAVLFAEERHGLVMDWATHRYLHTTEGTKYVSGLYLGNYITTGTGNLDSDAQVSVSDGVIADEDIRISIRHSATPTGLFEQVLSPIAEIPIIYRQSSSGSWFRTVANDAPLKMGTTYPQWNEFTGGAWQITEAASGTFIAMWVLATNDLREPVIALMGQSIDTTLSDARLNNDYTQLDVSGLPFLEMRPLFRVIYEMDSSYTNSYKSAIRDVVSIQISPTIQITQAIASGTVTSVNVSGGTTGLTANGGPITLSGTISLGGTLLSSHGGTGLSSIGTSNQVLGVNTSATGLEYKTIAAGTGISITPSAGTITVNATNNGTVTSVALSGGTTGLTFTGTPITDSGTITMSGTLNAVNGGTGFNTYAIGDILYANTTTTLARRAAVATGNALISAGISTAPVWGKIGLTTHVTGVLPVANGGTGLSTTPTNGQLNIGNGTGFTRATLTAGTGISITNGAGSITINSTNTGTVTSVGLDLPNIFSVTGSPVTTSGTLTGTLATQSANTFFVGPASGGAATPTFRTVSIDELSDVVITSPAANQVMTYNGSNWVNTGVQGANATGTVGVSPSGGGTSWALVSGNLYSADFVHNLGTTNVVVTLWDTNNNEVVIANSLSTVDNNTVRLTAIGNTRTIKVVVVANGQSIVAGGSTPSSVITAYEDVNVSTSATRLNFRGQAVGVVDAGSGTTNIIIGSRFTFFANSLDTPVNSDFAVNAIASTVTDPAFPSLNVRSFSNSVEQGVAFLTSIPSGATTMTLKIRGRAQTAPGVASVVQPRLYARLLPNNSSVGAWSAAKELTNISIPTNANFQYYVYSASLATLSLSADSLYQFELTRRVTGVTGTNLAANFLLAELTVEFS